jgi:hypothetical protein
MNRCITCKAIYIIEVAQTQLLHLLHAPKVPSPTHKGQIFPQPYLFKIQQQEKVTRNRKKLLPLRIEVFVVIGFCLQPFVLFKKLCK